MVGNPRGSGRTVAGAAGGGRGAALHTSRTDRRDRVAQAVVRGLGDSGDAELLVDAASTVTRARKPGGSASS
ncbi:MULTISPECIES: hypothetical protein [Lentzea]|uniref:hypothetical protein n=1 Tax=Lentzea TaxID=165301 RepID=UPI00115FE6A8|nr:MULTISPECIES: hypothetical protein [Lentzea]